MLPQLGALYFFEKINEVNAVVVVFPFVPVIKTIFGKSLLDVAL